MDPNKKRFSCSECKYEAVTKYIVEQHILKSKTLHKGGDSPAPYVIDTRMTSCNYCHASIKTMTRINHMEQHLKICTMKDPMIAMIINNTQNIQNINNTYINININPYNYPTTRHLVYDENLARNRIELFKQLYFNDKVPQNHSLVYDEKSNMIKIYGDNTCYISIELEKLGSKISAPLDRIQQQLLEDNIIDKDEVKRINNIIDSTYSEYEKKNILRYGEIAKDYRDIPEKTRRILDQEIERIKEDEEKEENEKEEA